MGFKGTVKDLKSLLIFVFTGIQVCGILSQQDHWNANQGVVCLSLYYIEGKFGWRMEDAATDI